MLECGKRVDIVCARRRYHRYRRCLALTLLVAVVAAGFNPRGAGAASSPRVVVSILPLHSLIADVMAGIGEPMLLIEGNASPHAYSLRPVSARALAAADAVFWIGPDLETFLAKPVAALAGRARAVSLMGQPGIDLLPVRVGGIWEHADGHAGEEPETPDEPTAAEAGSGRGRFDPHIWLSPDNARQIVRTAAAVLAELDPANAPTYGANAARLEAKLGNLEREIANTLAAVHAVPFIVFHDSYQYFEAHFGLNAVGAFALNPAVAPGARRLRDLRTRIVEGKVACVFVEPQFAPAVVQAAVSGTVARVAVLDPLGAGLTAGAGTYGQVLRGLADALATCLGGKTP